MKESIYKKIALPVVFLSSIMIGVFAVHWFREQQKVHTLVLATASEKGQYHAFGQALAKIVKKHNPKINIQVIPSEGSQQNEQWLNQKKAQLALVQSDTLLSPSISTVSLLFPEVFHLVVRKDSGIKNLSDLKGKKIALMTKGSGSYRLFWLLSGHYGLKTSEITSLPMSSKEAIQALETGKVDAMFQVIALGNPNITQLLQNPNVQLMAIDQGAALQLALPVLENTTIPKGTYSGALPIPQTDLPTVSVRAILVAHNQVNANLIHDITRILYEARNELVKENVQAAMIAPPNSPNQVGFTFHPGAKAYYDQDKPSFIVQYAEPIGLGISVAVLCISGLWQLRMWLEGTQKNRADLYNLQLIELIQKINTANNLQELKEIQKQLWEIFEKVIVDLDCDRISPESFQSFTFPWDVALKTIHHRETLLSTTTNTRLPMPNFPKV